MHLEFTFLRQTPGFFVQQMYLVLTCESKHRKGRSALHQSRFCNLVAMPSVFASRCTPTVSVLNLHGMSAKGKGAKAKRQTPVERKYKCRLMSNVYAKSQVMLFLKQGGTNSFRCEMEKRYLDKVTPNIAYLRIAYW